MGRLHQGDSSSRTLVERLGLVCALSAMFVARVHGNAADEVKRLAALMEWKPGTIAADIGAGDGKYTFAAVERVGPSGKVYATEIDPKKLEELQGEVAKRKLENVTVVESKEADTNLPSGCCDAIFLRHVYHHLTKPAEFDRNLARSLKLGGRLAIIDFAPRSGLEPVEGVPSNRDGHGIAQKLVIEELSAAGFEVEKIVNDWPDDSYCVLLVKR
ncbi:MAG TPA: methyltransferase domain-containing protein [Candidatus Dormibacteraeota bacterium]|nr:methyltransferase domain-containing protein [Candidatus Dormibacteraeota bacterium]